MTNPHTRRFSLPFLLALAALACSSTSRVSQPENLKLAGTYLDVRDGQGQLSADLHRLDDKIDGRFVLTKNVIDEQIGTLTASVEGRAVSDDSLYLILHWSKADSGICIINVVSTMSVRIGDPRVAYLGRYWPRSLSGPMAYGTLVLKPAP